MKNKWIHLLQNFQLSMLFKFLQLKQFQPESSSDEDHVFNKYVHSENNIYVSSEIGKEIPVK